MCSNLSTHPAAAHFAYLDSRWAHAVFHTSTWRSQYVESFELPPLRIDTLNLSDLQNWRHPPRSAGRPAVHGRVEANVLSVTSHRCGFCNIKGHNRATCKNKDLDLVYMEATHDARFYVPLPHTAEVKFPYISIFNCHCFTLF